jgi:hypothetical protein
MLDEKYDQVFEHTYTEMINAIKVFEPRALWTRTCYIDVSIDADPQFDMDLEEVRVEMMISHLREFMMRPGVNSFMLVLAWRIVGLNLFNCLNDFNCEDANVREIIDHWNPCCIEDPYNRSVCFCGIMEFHEGTTRDAFLQARIVHFYEHDYDKECTSNCVRASDHYMNFHPFEPEDLCYLYDPESDLDIFDIQEEEPHQDTPEQFEEKVCDSKSHIGA